MPELRFVDAATEAHFAAMSAIHCRGWRAAYPGFVPDDYLRDVTTEDHWLPFFREDHATGRCRGLLLYDRKHQDMHAGASGCGCSASVLNGYLLRKMREGKWKTILFAPTGALLSPTSSGQGESIPSICHAVRLCAVRE